MPEVYFSQLESKVWAQIKCHPIITNMERILWGKSQWIRWAYVWASKKTKQNIYIVHENKAVHIHLLFSSCSAFHFAHRIKIPANRPKKKVFQNSRLKWLHVCHLLLFYARRPRSINNISNKWMTAFNFYFSIPRKLSLRFNITWIWAAHLNTHTKNVKSPENYDMPKGIRAFYIQQSIPDNTHTINACVCVWQKQCVQCVAHNSNDGCGR